jgi:hypothetical protein
MENLAKHYSAIVFMFFAVAFLLVLTYPDPLVIAPSKRRIEAAFIGCIDVDRPWVMKGLRQLLVRFVLNELKTGCGLYLIWEYHDDTQVRGTRLCMGVVQYILDA